MRDAVDVIYRSLNKLMLPNAELRKEVEIMRIMKTGREEERKGIEMLRRPTYGEVARGGPSFRGVDE